MERFSIQIPQPCHQRWDEMQPTERGWFCASCQKTVVDYTNFSDQELVKLLSKPLDTTCGRFRNEQLNRMLTAPNAVTSRVWRHWANLLTLSLFGWQTARAQFNQPAQPAFIQQIPVTPAIRVTTQLSHTATDKNWVIYGRVVTKDSSGNLLPLPDATIFVLQSGNNLVIRTDQAGAYSLSVPAQMDTTRFTIIVTSSKHHHRTVSIEAVPSISLIPLNDIVLENPNRALAITGGALTIVQQPSFWEKVKRTLRRKRA